MLNLRPVVVTRMLTAKIFPAAVEGKEAYSAAHATIPWGLLRNGDMDLSVRPVPQFFTSRHLYAMDICSSKCRSHRW